MRHGKSLTTRQQLIQALQVGWIIVDDRIEKGGSKPRGCYPMDLNRPGQPSSGRYRFAVQDTLATVEQRAPNFKGGGVKAERCGVQECYIIREANIFDVPYQSNDRSMTNLDALWLSGRSGCVHDVRNRITVLGR